MDDVAQPEDRRLYQDRRAQTNVACFVEKSPVGPPNQEGCRIVAHRQIAGGHHRGIVLQEACGQADELVEADAPKPGQATVKGGSCTAISSPCNARNVDRSLPESSIAAQPGLGSSLTWQQVRGQPSEPR